MIDTKTRQTGNEQRKHGLISMLSMIIGVVIGSGIFIKNNAMYGHTGSAIMSMVAWGIISIVVLLMTISFIEIASGSAKKKVSSSYGNWASMFFNDKMGKVINIFFTLIYLPGLLIFLGSVAAEFLGAGIFEAMGKDMYDISSATGAWRNYGIIAGGGVALVFLLFVMNNKTHKGGKLLQVGGTGLKLIPLITVIIIALVFVIGGFSPEGSNSTNIGDPSKNPGLDLSKEGFDMGTIISGLFLALPAAMYTFDGFAHSAILQNEAKSKTTYKTSLAIGMIIIVVLYLLSSWAMFFGGGESGYFDEALQEWITFDFSVSKAITGLLGSKASWLGTTVTFLIFISILTGLSGYIILSIRQYSLLSSENIFPDLEGKVIARNGNGIPSKSGWLMLATTMIWGIYLLPMDAIDVNLSVQAGEWDIWYYASTEYVVDFSTVGAFVVYALLVIGGLSNRKTNKIDVDKVKGFVPASIIASITISVIAGYMVFDIFNSLATTFKAGGDGISAHVIGKFTTMVISVVSVTGLYFYFDKNVKLVTDNQWKNKEFHIRAYESAMTPIEYKEFLNKTVKVAKKPAVKKTPAKKRVVIKATVKEK